MPGLSFAWPKLAVGKTRASLSGVAEELSLMGKDLCGSPARKFTERRSQFFVFFVRDKFSQESLFLRVRFDKTFFTK